MFAFSTSFLFMNSMFKFGLENVLEVKKTDQATVSDFCGFLLTYRLGPCIHSSNHTNNCQVGLKKNKGGKGKRNIHLHEILQKHKRMVNGQHYFCRLLSINPPACSQVHGTKHLHLPLGSPGAKLLPRRSKSPEAVKWITTGPARMCGLSIPP